MIEGWSTIVHVRERLEYLHVFFDLKWYGALNIYFLHLVEELESPDSCFRESLKHVTKLRIVQVMISLRYLNLELIPHHGVP